MEVAGPLVRPEASSRWQHELQATVRDLRLLEDLLPGLKSGPWAERYRIALEHAELPGERFRFAVTHYYLGLARPEDGRCPILRQILPDPAELCDTTFSSEDPLAEEQHMPVSGLTHRYPDRVLWYLTHNCAVYCRFCMRKRKVARPGTGPARSDLQQAFQYIEGHTEIREVILSGGDPLSLGDDALEEILGRLRRIPHVISLRIHTRMPVTLPSRITSELCRVLEDHDPLTIVTHFNHARELSEVAREGLSRLRRTGALLLNQSVLLRGVNDSLDDQQSLLLGLIGCGVKPYYLHQCDEVQGLSHFRVPLETGMELMRNLRGTIPGIALPTYVVDLPGGLGKVPVDSNYRLQGGPAESYRYHNGHGRTVELAPFSRPLIEEDAG